MGNECKICGESFIFTMQDNVGKIRNPFIAPKDIDICFSCIDKINKWHIIDDTNIHTRANNMVHYWDTFKKLPLEKQYSLLNDLLSGSLKLSLIDSELLR